MLLPAAGIDPPTIANDKNNGLRHSAHFRDVRRRAQALSLGWKIDKRDGALIDRRHEMAQPVARAFLPRALRGFRCFLFSTLGRPKTVRYYSVHWRRANTLAPCRHTCFRWWVGCASVSRFDAARGPDDKLLERFCGTGRCRRRNHDRHRAQGRK